MNKQNIKGRASMLLGVIAAGAWMLLTVTIFGFSPSPKMLSEAGCYQSTKVYLDPPSVGGCDVNECAECQPRNTDASGPLFRYCSCSATAPDPETTWACRAILRQDEATGGWVPACNGSDSCAGSQTCNLGVAPVGQAKCTCS